MKMLFCHPSQKVSFDGVKARPMVGPPLGILMVAGYLREAGVVDAIEVYDARMSGKLRNEDSGKVIFGDTSEEVAARIKVAEADVIGISNMFSSQIEQAYEMADIARLVSPNATIVIGGPHVTVDPMEALSRSSIDYVVMGEGEERMAQLLQALAANEPVNVEGVVGREADMLLLRSNPRARISFLKSLDDLPLPAYDLVNMKSYFDLAHKGYSPRFREWGNRAISMITSRGCPHKCVFCSIQTTMGYKFRPHSTDYVQRHIQHLRDEYGVDFIHFEDDNFTHNTERYDSIIDFLIALDTNIGWDTPNGVRGDVWDRQRVRNAKKSGCQFLTVAIESAVQSVLDNVVRKQLDISKADEMIRYCSEEKLRLHAFYIVGFPGETIENMRETLEFALDRYWRYGVMPFLQPLIPIPGTEVYDTIIEEGLHDGIVMTEYNQVTTSDFTPAQIQELYKEFLRRRLIIFAKRSFTSVTDFIYNTKLIAKYPQAVMHAVKNAISATG